MDAWRYEDEYRVCVSEKDQKQRGMWEERGDRE